MKRFFDRPDTHWRNLSGALHVYALPDANSYLVKEARETASWLNGAVELAVQPVDYLHMTIQRLDLYREEIPSEIWDELTNHLAMSVADIESFDVEYAPATVRAGAIEAVSDENPSWKRLVDAVRESFCNVGLKHALVDPPFGPHYTVAYCVQDTDAQRDDELCQLLVDAPATSMRVSSVDLVAVDQSPEEGVFRFSSLMHWPLRGA